MTLLTCTDGSIYAPSIYQHSAWAATRLSAGVRVLHVLDVHRTGALNLKAAVGFDANVNLVQEIADLEETQSRVALARGAAILEDARIQLNAAGVSSVETLHRKGNFVENLLDLESSAEMVVIGKRGEHADFSTGHLGGQVERVIRASIRPVLVASRTFKPIQRVLVAHDGGDSITKAIDYLSTHPLVKGLHCHLLRVGKVNDDGKWFLGEDAGRLRDSGCAATTEVRPGSPEEVIAAAVREEAFDLLVMGAYGHGPIRQLVFGSTTTTMARTCGIPVLMFR